MTLDELLDAAQEDEPGRGPRARAFLLTFSVAVVTATVGLVLLSVLLYGLGIGGAAVWSEWWSDFA